MKLHNILLVLAVKTSLTLLSMAFASPVWAVEYIDEDDVVEESVLVSNKVKPAHAKVIINNQQKVEQKSNTGQLSNQPTVHVKDVPIRKTFATELRKSRTDAEIETEQKIVEKLESARLRDEQERYNRLFGKPKPHSVRESEHTKIVVPHTTHSYPVQAIAKDTDENDRAYLGLMAGQITNLSQQLINVQSFGSFGASFGTKDNSGLIIEGALYYSQHQITPMGNLFMNNIFNVGNFFSSTVQHLTGVLALMYSPMTSRMQPYAGVAASYNLWMYQHNNTYNMMNFNCHLNYQFCANGFYKTNSIDIGINAGMDIKLNKKMDVGVNLLLNILNVYNNHSRMYNNYYLQSAFYGMNGLFTPTAPISLEETNWIIATLSAKFHF